ncbi:MAG: isoleucine--tRNA ligase [Clostridia bacterium]|nr:isoleucine--tRNA ligase [Clostridia bacterium]MBN2882355.1 isoleucine--tRNA ligase [Clostridia bacterium]
MYKKVSTKLDFAEREKETRQFWKENDIFRKSIENREGAPVFTFYDGPPTANGLPHIGHILTRVIKDLIPRYRTMKGYKVLRKAGWDTHGLPVELEVEKMLGIDGKPEIEKYGVEPFIKKCKESVWKYKGNWEIMSEKVGFWADMDNPYITYENDYIESVWWALKTIWDKGLLYKGHKIVPYCPRCGTSLSSHEVAQGYKDVHEESIYVKFKVKGVENTYFMAWTTTPWTLPSNLALTVGPDNEYVKVLYNGENIILAKSLATSVLGDSFEIVETYKGAQLEGMEYEPLFDFVKPDKKAYYVCLGDFVTLTEGTGIVHTAPAFGEDDAVVGRKYGLPFVQLVDEQGHMTEETDFIAGMFVKDADPVIIEYLTKKGLLFKINEYEHSYPFCWRCDTHLIYYARNSWFIEMTKLKENLLANNDKINWYPPAIGEARFGNFLKNVVDWGISRERYWGTPLPIWECSCGHRDAIGSIAELKQRGINVPDDIELHKPYIDQIHLTCPECGGEMSRVSEVIDCWFDSGAMPFAQWHYPFENKELFEENFPADFISEALDQTRGWFYTLLAISTLLFDEPAYKNCVVLGLVQNKDGQKMSKSKGDYVDPDVVLDNQGADAVRWYFYTASAPWLPSKFYEEAVSEGQRKFMGTFWNTYAFYVLYADIDKFNPLDYKLEYAKLGLMDRWILSKLNSLVKYTDESLAVYRITEPARAMQKFVDELSNWYVRRGRERFWQKENNQDKINAYMTLYTVLVTLAKISAPFVPFMSEEIYRNLVAGIDSQAPESVHLCDFPECDNSAIDENLEKFMEEVLCAVVMGRSLRNTANIKNRQPVAELLLKSETELPADYLELIRDELNVKKVSYIEDASTFIDYNLKPQLKTLGPKYGKLIPKIYKALADADGSYVMSEFDKGNTVSFSIDGTDVILEKDDVLSETTQKRGFLSETSGSITAVLDTNMTDELIEEGFVREMVSKIQTMRKEAGFEVQDHILLFADGSKTILEVVGKNKDNICSEILADGMFGNLKDSEYQKEWDINGETATFGLKKV